MGVSIAICELDSDVSLCKKGKMSILKVNLKDLGGFEDVAEFDMVIAMDDAKRILGGEAEPFFKKNRIDPEAEVIYLEKVKLEADRVKLEPASKKVFTGWVEVDKVDPAKRSILIERSDADNRLTGWDMLSFEEMGSTCAKCELSWDEGRGCMGTFGPENSALPSIAQKYGCGIIASVPEGVNGRRMYTPQEATKLLEEIKLLREKLPDEGKVMVRRYSGVLDRLEKMAKVSIKYGTRFYFL